VGYKLAGSTSCNFLIGEELGPALGGEDVMWFLYCSFSEPSLILHLCGREVTCGICDFPGKHTRGSIHSPNDVCPDAGA